MGNIMAQRSFKIESPSDIMYDIWHRIDDAPACWNLLHLVFTPIGRLEDVDDMLVNEFGIESSSPL